MDMDMSIARLEQRDPLRGLRRGAIGWSQDIAR